MRQEFFEHLSKGEFRIPVCSSCSTKVWPPSPICRKCHGRVSLRKSVMTGTLLEFSESHVKEMEGIFGVVDLGGVKVIGTFGRQNLRKGIRVRLTECGVSKDGTVYYRFVSASDRH